jgi:prepilin-type N-terminal cleavage/methylation domain-containing protein
MTSPTGETRRRRADLGLTLIELVLVLAVLAIVVFVTAPRLTRTMQARALREEALRFLALTRHARSLAVDEGMPACLWIDPAGRAYGVGPAVTGDTDEGGSLRFTLGRGLEFGFDDEPDSEDGLRQICFESDGGLAEDSVTLVRLVPGEGTAFEVALTGPGQEYAIRKTAE